MFETAGLPEHLVQHCNAMDEVRGGGTPDTLAVLAAMMQCIKEQISP